MHVYNHTNWETGEEKMDYHITLILNGSNKTNFHLTVNVHDNSYSKRNPQTNYTYTNETILTFGQSKNIFYNIKEDLYNHIDVTNDVRSKKQKVNGNFPVIILGKETYYYINNRWFQSCVEKEMAEI